MSDDALEEDIHPSLSRPDFCPVPVCFNVRERAFRAVDVPQNAININTLEFVDCLREAVLKSCDHYGRFWPFSACGSNVFLII